MVFEEFILLSDREFNLIHLFCHQDRVLPSLSIRCFLSLKSKIRVLNFCFLWKLRGESNDWQFQEQSRELKDRKLVWTFRLNCESLLFHLKCFKIDQIQRIEGELQWRNDWIHQEFKDNQDLSQVKTKTYISPSLHHLKFSLSHPLLLKDICLKSVVILNCILSRTNVKYSTCINTMLNQSVLEIITLWSNIWGWSMCDNHKDYWCKFKAKLKVGLSLVILMLGVVFL